MKRLLMTVCLIASALPSLSANDQRARVLLQAAEAKAKVEGDLTAAIKLYRDAEKEAGANRALVAQALVKMADAYQALGNAEAQKIYGRLVRDFSDQKEAVIARSRLVSPSPRPGATLRDVADLNNSGNVSADGRFATYVNWETGNIAVRDLLSGVSREVTARSDYIVYHPRLSRDGARVAFQSFNRCVENRFDASPLRGVLCVLAIDGAPAAVARTVVDQEDITDIRPLDWSPDGQSLAVSVKRADKSAQVAVVKVADGRLTVLQTVDWRGPTVISYSPDGRYLAFDLPVDETSPQRDIQVIAVDGSQKVVVVESPGQDVVMGWTTDGSHLLFSSDRSGQPGLWAQRLTQGKVDGQPQLVHAGLGGLLSLGVTNTGSLYFGLQADGRDVEVVSVDLQSGTQTATARRPVSRYVGTNMMPRWSPDGKFLAYVSKRGISGNTGYVIGILEMATGAVRELPATLDYMGTLSWSPDGRKLATTGNDVKGRSGMFEVDVADGRTMHIGEGELPTYAPGGRHLLFARVGDDHITRTVIERDLTSGAERPIFSGEFARFSVSPDGKLIAAAVGGVALASAHVIELIDVASGRSRELLRAKPGERIPPYTAMPWTPDGQGLLMRKILPKPELWLVPTSGAPPRRIAADLDAWGFGTFGALSLHPDGHRIAATRVSPAGAEVRVLENFLSAVK